MKSPLLILALASMALPMAASAQDALFCGALQGVLADRANHFQHLRSDKREKDVWNVSLKLGHATSCELDKDDGDWTYICEYDLADHMDTDAAAAQVKSLADAYANAILQCEPGATRETSGDDIWVSLPSEDKLIFISPTTRYFNLLIGDH